MDEDRNFLPQINLAMIFGESSRLSIRYRGLPGNIADVTIVFNPLADIYSLKTCKVVRVLDRGFCSKPISMSHTADTTYFSSTWIIETETSFRRNL